MKRNVWVLGVLLACGMTGLAGAQFAPPDAAGGGGSVEAGGGGMSIAPPLAEPSQAAERAGGRANRGTLRVNPSFTANVLVGHVNDEPVYVNDILQPLDQTLRRLAASARSQGEFEQAVQPLIDNQMKSKTQDMLLLSAAQRKLTADDKERLRILAVKDKNELITKYGGVETLANKALQATGSSLDKELNDMNQKQMVSFYVYKYISSRIEVTYPMVRAAYDRDPKKWQQPATIELFTITLPVSRWLRTPTSDGTLGPVKSNPTPDEVRSAENQALATAKEIVGKIRGGADFAGLVDQYNSRDTQANYGGRQESVTRDDLSIKKLSDFVFSLPANTVGDPLLLRETDFNRSMVVVAKVGKKREAKTVSFAEAQGQIEKTLRNSRFNELQSEEMTKLRATAAVEGLDRNLDLVVDAAVSRYLK